MKDPLISILLPFKDTARYLKECIESIQTQNYREWEVLAVDDHSSDESRSVMESFVITDPRIKVFNNRGSGIIDALVLAHSQSSGEFITRMDSDDIMGPGRLKVMVRSLQRAGIGHIALGQVRYFRDGKIGEGYRSYEQWLNGLTGKGKNFDEIYKECVIPSPCWMVHRKDLGRSGAFLPKRYPEDYDLAFRFYASGLKCLPCQEVLHLWRDHGERASRNSGHYAENSFLDIKVHYFLKLHKVPVRPLALWGAGKKGKKLAQLFLREQIRFYWICNNPKKIGKDIYGKVLLPLKELDALGAPQIIVAVANAGEQRSILDHLKARDLKNMQDFFFFC
jgi:glycosyltransferase involved in cell wall biosynthesis